MNIRGFVLLSIIIVMFSCPQTDRQEGSRVEPTPTTEITKELPDNAYPFINKCFGNCVQHYGSDEVALEHCKERCIQNEYDLDDDDLEKIERFNECCSDCERFEWGSDFHKRCYSDCKKQYLEE